jgi:hypothetical protein
LRIGIGLFLHGRFCLLKLIYPLRNHAGKRRNLGTKEYDEAGSEWFSKVPSGIDGS